MIVFNEYLDGLTDIVKVNRGLYTKEHVISALKLVYGEIDFGFMYIQVCIPKSVITIYNDIVDFISKDFTTSRFRVVQFLTRDDIYIRLKLSLR